MDSVSFRPGKAYLSSLSPAVPWAVIFEDEGDTAYFYAIDTRRGDSDDRILDAVLIYNVKHIPDAEREHLASIVWSPDGLKALLYLNGYAHAIFDFQNRCGYCRTNFPNFMEDQLSAWRTSSHAWNDDVLQEFEATLYR
ncbi:DUF2251 domain-containing protein [Terriglobus albidus]|uniref:DUF2251 domain-containing protein n=1 Tax=Terriglobus albidus TaxID=1592106 RepID=A0A5B9E5M7_9BACT|nr:DUF2251 domain-containing protein [Terriglobus albidus]QEE27099.1 DUF2251 domain-containing protein [Terriglobus albidus]